MSRDLVSVYSYTNGKLCKIEYVENGIKIIKEGKKVYRVEINKNLSENEVMFFERFLPAYVFERNNKIFNALRVVELNERKEVYLAGINYLHKLLGEAPAPELLYWCKKILEVHYIMHAPRKRGIFK